MSHPILPPDPALTSALGRPSPTIWAFMSDAEYTAKVAELQIWVTWLMKTHPSLSSSLRDCWPQHPELVERLGALRDAWRHAYHPTSPACEPLAWLDHLANHARALRDEFAGHKCRQGAPGEVKP